MNDTLLVLLEKLAKIGEDNDARETARPKRMLNITRDTGRFLWILVRTMGATRILEVGTSNAFSTIWLADAARSILDGHIVLSRELASMGHYPAIDVLSSISRVMTDIVTPEHRKCAMKVKAVLAVYKKAYDLVSIGAYKEGSDPKVDHAVKVIDRVNNFLNQDISEGVNYDDSLQGLFGLPV